MRKRNDYLEDLYPKLQRDLRTLGYQLACEEMRGVRGGEHIKGKKEHRRMLNKLYSLIKVS